MSTNSNRNMNMAMMSQNTKHYTSSSGSIWNKNALNFSQIVKSETSKIIRFGFGVPCVNGGTISWICHAWSNNKANNSNSDESPYLQWTVWIDYWCHWFNMKTMQWKHTYEQWKSLYVCSHILYSNCFSSFCCCTPRFVRYSANRYTY